MRRLLSVLLLVLAPVCAGQEELPTLEELLGLEPSAAEEAGAEQGEDAGADGELEETDAERLLRRELSGERSDEPFLEAVRLMGESASRLADDSDAGTVTQRLQEEILRKLDRAIEQAQNQQSSSSSSSSGSSSEPQAQQQPNQQQSQGSQTGQGDNQSEADAPPGSDASPAQAVAPDRARWGALPERVREALSQGSSDRFSAVYRRMTESYYKRLAEEATE